MLVFEKAKPTIEQLLMNISKIVKADFAIIHKKGQLIISTNQYLTKKGQTVHMRPVEEAFHQEFLLVDEPGRMDMCQGCRFQFHCPAKYELLKTIRLHQQAIGVLSLTFFKKNEHADPGSDYHDYLEILHNVTDIIVSILELEDEQLTESPPETNLLPLEQIKGETINITKLKSQIVKIKNSTSTILLTGETGTGKTTFARAIHSSSSRSTHPFIAINCASIPESLFESELFGYESGAFTGAKKGGKKGYFELANNGTIFLDEIGEIPYHLQAKLLKVLEESTIYRVGGIEPISISPRIIASTNQKLEGLIEAGKFREDLYYRLCVIPFEIPPLRSRKTDIELLAFSFLQKHATKLGKSINFISEEAMQIFLAHEWPGNVRELENAMEYAVNMETSGNITKYSLPERILRQTPVSQGQAITDKYHALQKEIIQEALDKYGHNTDGKKLAAKELGISIRTLYRRMEK